MSRPLPPDSGIPVKTVVRTTSGESVRLRDQTTVLQGRIGQAVAAARQNLAQLDVGSVTRQILGGVVQFTKNSGQEQVLVTISLPEVKPLVEPDVEKPIEYPDYCIVDFVIPDAAVVEARFLALGVEPDEFLGEPFAGELELDFPTAAATYSADKEPGRALMQYSREASRAEGLIPVTTRTASLKIDLREIAPGARVRFDVWGRYTPTGSSGSGTPDVLDERESLAWRRSPFFLDWEFFDGTGTSGSEAPVFDPLGNLIYSDELFTSTGIRRFSPVPDLLFLQMFAETIRPDEWDETTYSEVSNADPADGVGEYTQKRFDPNSGAVIESRTITFSYTQERTIDTHPFFDQPADRVVVTLKFAQEVAKEVDVVTQFYRKSELKAFDTSHPDGAGIWATEALVPERRQVGQGTIDSDNSDEGVEFAPGSGKLVKIGSVTVDRVGESTIFQPA